MLLKTPATLVDENIAQAIGRRRVGGCPGRQEQIWRNAVFNDRPCEEVKQRGTHQPVFVVTAITCRRLTRREKSNRRDAISGFVDRASAHSE